MAVNEVLNALKPSQIDTSSGQLHVDSLNGMSTSNSSFPTTAARENLVLDSDDGLPGCPRTPTVGRSQIASRGPRE